MVIFSFELKLSLFKENFDLNMRKATAKIVMNSQCEKIYKPTTSGNICITTDPLRSMCVVSY